MLWGIVVAPVVSGLILGASSQSLSSAGVRAKTTVLSTATSRATTALPSSYRVELRRPHNCGRPRIPGLLVRHPQQF